MTTRKSPRRVFQVAYEAVSQALPTCRDKFSPKKFTRPQLMTCLVLEEPLRLDCREFAAHPVDHPDPAGLISLKAISRYTTFQEAAARLFKVAPACTTFDAVPARALKLRKPRVPLAAVDGNGMESRHVGRSYVKRRSKTGTGTRETTDAKHSKVALVTDCRTRLILAAVPGRGPASDPVHFKAASKQAASRARLGTLPAEADFDGQRVHESVRSLGVGTPIPPERGRPSEKPPEGKRPRRMKQRFDKMKYDRRWQTETVESVNSMIKRRLGSALRAWSCWSPCREIILRVITHNIMIII